MQTDHYTYRVTWSAEGREHVGLCAEFPSRSWLAKTPPAALLGIRRLVAQVVSDMKANRDSIPEPLAERHRKEYDSGRGKRGARGAVIPSELKSLVARITPKNLHGEVGFGPPVGREASRLAGKRRRSLPSRK